MIPCTKKLNGTTITCHHRDNKFDNFTLGCKTIVQVLFKDFTEHDYSVITLLPTTTTTDNILYDQDDPTAPGAAEARDADIASLAGVSSHAIIGLSVFTAITLLLLCVIVVLLAIIFRQGRRRCGRCKQKRNSVLGYM